MRPEQLAHYCRGPAFRSMLDLDAGGRAELLASGSVHLPARYADPTYVATRHRVERALREGFVAAGGRPVRERPHYGLLGRSERTEARAAPGLAVHLLDLADLPGDQVSFTWGDSFAFDPAFRAATNADHPLVGQVFPLRRLDEVLAGRTHGDRPAWMAIELQLWMDPDPPWVTTVRLG
ncbi:MAG: hypothetical protein H6736_12870 [Alphaproteobacteria bacterium]|nr:hypothetical protein [Alphaproteobacteria bacterium]